MTRLVPALLVAAALVSSAGAAPPERVLAVEWQAGGGRLRWVSPTTLRPLGTAAVNVGGAPVDVTAVAPDGTRAALGGGRGRLRLLDLQPLRSTGFVGLGGDSSVASGLWLTPDRLVLLTYGLPPQVVVVDPDAKRVVARHNLNGIAAGVAETRDRLLTLLARDGVIGDGRLAVIASDGSVRTVALPGIRAGFAPPRTRGKPGRQVSPGLAASPDGTQAAVVGLDRLAIVDLETLTVRTRALPLRTPARSRKLVEGWGRRAVWATADSIAASGWSESWDGGVRKHVAAGLRLVDLRSTATRLLDADAAGGRVVGSTLLAYGGDALRGYTLAGSLRFELLEGRDTGFVQTAGRFAYVGSENATRYAVVDTGAGRVVHTVRTPKQTIILDLP